MHRIRFAAPAAALLLSTSLSAQLDPNQPAISVGPLGGSATEVVIHPTDPDEILIVKYTIGLFRSTDGGVDFAPYGIGYSGAIREIKTDPQNPTTLYALDGQTVIRSTDFGATWVPLNLFANENLKDVAIAHTGNDLLAVDAFNVYHSDDGGTSWTVADSTVPFGGEVYDKVRFAPTNASIAYMAYNDGVKRSTDGGQSFAQAGPFDEWVQAITVSPLDADTVFVGTPFNGVFRSTDGGASFASLTVPTTQFSLNAEFFSWEPGTNRLWFATLVSTHYSDDFGDNWTQVSAGFPANQPIPLVMAFDQNGRRYLGTEGGGLNDQSGGGLYRMEAGAPTAWEHVAFLEVPVELTRIPVPGGPRVVGLGSGVYSSTGPGETLKPTAYTADIGVTTYAFAVDPTDPDRWVTGGVGAFFDNAQIAVLTNGGDDFFKAYEMFGAGQVSTIEFDPHVPNRVLAGMFPAGFGSAALVGSIDGGDTWLDIAGTAGWATRAIAYDPINAGNVYQLSDNNQWARSFDGGLTWTLLAPAWPNAGRALFLEYDLFEEGVLYRGDEGLGLWRSNDDGANWSQLGINLSDDSRLTQHPQLPGLLWVSDDSGNVVVSTDRGDTFDTLWSVPNGTNAGDMAIDTSDGTLFVGTRGMSAWELPLGSPFERIGDGTPGSGGLEPRHFGTGGLCQVGNAGFTLAGDQVVGGAIVFAVYGWIDGAIPVFGGSLYMSAPLGTLGAFADGTPGVAGDGDFEVALPLPANPNLAGFELLTQLLVVDPGAADISGVALSAGLRSTIVP